MIGVFNEKTDLGYFGESPVHKEDSKPARQKLVAEIRTPLLTFRTNYFIIKCERLRVSQQQLFFTLTLKVVFGVRSPYYQMGWGGLV